MLDYLRLYVKLDVALLADIFLKFRNFMFKQFKLDPCHFISLPGFSFSCMLRMTGVSLESVTDPDIHNFLKQNIRGGFSFIHERRAHKQEATSNNSACNLAYYDANNLYGWAQSQRLPVDGFRFLSRKEIKKHFAKMLDSYNIKDGKSDAVGFIAEVDLHYPARLHKDHRSFPLAPEQMQIPEDILSPYQKKCHEVLKTKPDKNQKLVGTFFDRKKYVLHAANLKLYTRLGLQIKKVHRVLIFNESKFLEPYISFCTRMRSAAKNDFEKRMFKLLANSCFGKFIENTSKYLDMKLVKTREEFLKWATIPRYLNYLAISPDLVGVFLKRKSATSHQAHSVGFSILELSKHFMYESYYCQIKPALGKETSILMSDTDSIFLKTAEENPHQKLIEILDTSNFSKDNPLYDPTRKSKLGYFKSETGDQPVTKFVGLRAKCYSFTTETSNEVKVKGISKSYRKNLSMNVYEQCINNICNVSQHQRVLQSKNHVVTMTKQEKLAFSSTDNKFYILKCGIHTLPYGSIELWNNLAECTFCKQK